MKNMHNVTLDEDYVLLADLARGLRSEYADKRTVAWVNSPFGWVRNMPSRTVGAIGEKLIAGWCAARDFNVVRSPDSDADRVIEGMPVEIKFSTLWEGGFYKFQQIRNQNYDVLLCFGVSPDGVHGWIFRKQDIPFEHLEHQHNGARGSDTWWITVFPNNPPKWMSDTQNGTFGYIRDFFTVIRNKAK